MMLNADAENATNDTEGYYPSQETVETESLIRQRADDDTHENAPLGTNLINNQINIYNEWKLLYALF